ncbi:PIG-L family deacetylase [Brevibacterium salitolerans]|uniref:N-acetyl-1-D-myo-inositol-2-amino-2-deoxy-alpha-D-glucopyranoside deacetylase n=1 Tax=Brevibacterium salitolerans TaxID=1403566 RepID=A0ABN2WDA7_9MICO
MSTPTVLFVHAHPDDESIATGGTLARLVRAGARVVLLTATRGEGGEVIGEELAHLEGEREALAAHRENELAAAMRILGVRDHRFLGDPGDGAPVFRGDQGGDLPARRFEDSGMVWGADGHAHAPDSMPDAALCAADLGLVAMYVWEVIEDVRPDLVITYAADGGYGHPDHRRVHEATLAALLTRVRSGHSVPQLLTIVNPAEAVEERFDSSAPGFSLTGFAAAEKASTIADDVPVAVVEDVEEVIGLKAQAMAAHATQIMVAGEFFALSNGVGQRIDRREHFALVDVRADGAPALALPGAPFSDVLDLLPAPAPGLGVPIRTREGQGAADRAADRVSSAGAPTAAAAPASGAGAPGDGTASGAAGGSSAGVASSGRADARGNLADESWKATLGGVLHGLVIGLVVGVLGSFQHLNAFVWHVGEGGVIVPWGLVLALVLAVVGLWHMSVLYRSTIVTVITAAAISGVAYALAQPSLWPGADLVVTGSLRSLVWLFAPMIAGAVFVFATPGRRAGRTGAQRGPADAEQDSSTGR